jgi:hypothetical protein
MKTFRIAALALMVGALMPVLPAAAQPLGSFRWQLQPYCNILTLSVVQQGGQYQLDGTDDQCGAAQAAGVRGLAFQNPNGSIGFGLITVTAPGGTPIHVDATISIATLSGTWRDSAGNIGTFIFTPGAGAGGGPRPVPSGGIAANSVTTIQIAPAAVTNAQIANGAVTGASIANGSVTNADLASPPQLQSLATLSSVSLSSTAATIRAVSVTAPTAGKVMVTVSGTVQIAATAVTDFMQCSLTTTAGIESAGRVEVRSGVIGTTWTPFSITRAFNVGAGPFTANFICRHFGSPTNVIPYEVQTTALFVGQ